MVESLKEIAEDRDKVEEMGESIGFKDEEEITTLEQALRLRGIDQKISSEEFAKQKAPHKYSILDHIKGSVGYFLPDRTFPSHAEVTNIEYSENDEELKIEMKTLGYDAEITESYSYGDNPSDDLMSIFSLAGADIHNPSTLVGSKLPVEYDSGYVTHLPPNAPGLVKHGQYRFVRFGRNHNMLRVSSGSHRPNSKGYLSITSIHALATASLYLLLGPKPPVILLTFILTVILAIYGIRLVSKND